jgi:micrococcal nuclease
MKSVIAFWNKDVINKLIVLISGILLVGAIAIAYLLINLKDNSIFYAVFSPIIGGDKAVPTMSMATGPVVSETPTSISDPTMEMFTQMPTSEPATIEPTLNSTATSVVFAPTQPAATPSPQIDLLSSVQAAACIPANPPSTGKVLDVIDGNTIKVLIDGIAYTVRYIGIDVPKFRPVAEYFGQEADYKNAEFVFAKQITLIPDAIDKDESGRLLRYVKVGDTFVNYELVLNGFASASSVLSSCAQTFKIAEDVASQAKIGKWKPVAPVPTP